MLAAGNPRLAVARSSVANSAMGRKPSGGLLGSEPTPSRRSPCGDFPRSPLSATCISTTTSRRIRPPTRTAPWPATTVYSRLPLPDPLGGRPARIERPFLWTVQKAIVAGFKDRVLIARSCTIELPMPDAYWAGRTCAQSGSSPIFQVGGDTAMYCGPDVKTLNLIHVFRYTTCGSNAAMPARGGSWDLSRVWSLAGDGDILQIYAEPPWKMMMWGDPIHESSFAVIQFLFYPGLDLMYTDSTPESSRG